jgi:hypothetical protein
LLHSAVSNGRSKFKRSFKTIAGREQGALVNFFGLRYFGHSWSDDRLYGRGCEPSALPKAGEKSGGFANADAEFRKAKA